MTNQTNYNERLDKIIAQASAGIGGFGKLDNGKFYKGISETEAKQAITSLVKELVAEAKPTIYPYYTSPTNNGYEKSLYFAAIDQFEQNLLKALETRE